MPVVVNSSSSVVIDKTKPHQQMMTDLTSILSIQDLEKKEQQQQRLPVIRGIARSAVRWYRSKLNPHSSNETNVQTVLRTVIAHLTTEVLSSQSNSYQSKSDNPASSPSSHSSSSSSLVCPLSRRHQARMEAFLAGCTLAVPPTTTGGEAATTTTTTKKVSPCSQIPAADLQVRIELYLRCLQRFVRESSNSSSSSNINVHTDDECVLATEPDKDIRARARVTTNAFVATATYVGNNATEILTRLLVCLTMEVLAIEHVSEQELVEKIIKRRVVSEYIHGTSFASLAFLSTPEFNADTLLTPLIVKYLKMLQSDWKRCVKECEMERLIETQSTLQASTRSLFKAIEFQSIGHLLEVCHEFCSELRDIQLPSDKMFCATSAITDDTASSSMRRMKRHVITLNGSPLPPVTSNTSDLVEMLTTAIMNAGSMALKNHLSSGDSRRSTNAKKRLQVRAAKADDITVVKK